MEDELTTNACFLKIIFVHDLVVYVSHGFILA